MKSDIPDAGKGLFATKAFQTNKVIGAYAGENVSQATINSRYGNSKRDNAPYALSANNLQGRVLDAACRRSLMSVANSGRNRTQSNAKYSSVMKQDGTINVRATKRIKEGDEIPIWYGKDY